MTKITETRTMPPLRPSPMERLWRDTSRAPGGCWLWTGATVRGYGVMNLGTHNASRLRYAHRVAYEYLIEPIPNRLDLDHLCRTTLCVNPAHLEPVTRSTNAKRQHAARKAAKEAAA